MVRKEQKNGIVYYQCEACDFYYENEEIAKKCEDFCNKHNACNTELIGYSVKLDVEKTDKGHTCNIDCDCKNKGSCDC